MEIYSLPEDEQVVFPDVTVVPNDNPEAAKLVVSQRTDILFPEAGSDGEAAALLTDRLWEVHRASVDDSFKADLAPFEEFGIQSGTENVVQEILDRFVRLCRDNVKLGSAFGPGRKYNYLSNDSEGINVSFGDYGLGHATLQEAQRDQTYRRFLLDEGTKIGNPSAFIVNTLASNTVIHCGDRVLFVIRSNNVAEYPGMLHQAAAGHHVPDPTKEVVSLRDLIAYQIQTETGLGDEHIQDFSLLGLAFEHGSVLKGSEKVEVLTSARLDVTDEDVFDSFIAYAPHRWEHKSLWSIAESDLDDLVSGSENANAECTGLRKARPLNGKFESEITKSVRSSSFWVPVGLAGLKMDIQS